MFKCSGMGQAEQMIRKPFQMYFHIINKFMLSNKNIAPKILKNTEKLS